MKRLKRKFTITTMVLAVAGALLWRFVPCQAIFAVANLSDPAKLATLGERGANPRLNKVVFYLDQAQRQGFSPETVIPMTQILNGTWGPRAPLVKDSLLRNMKIAAELGLLEGANLDKLRKGQAGVAASGPYQGEHVEIDHIVPYSLAPEVGNELANLEMLPQTLNRRKSNHVSQRQVLMARKLFEAGLLKSESLAKVEAKARQ